MKDKSVIIVYESTFSQPEILANVNRVEIKRDNIVVYGCGYTKIFFKDKIKHITAEAGVRIIMR